MEGEFKEKDLVFTLFHSVYLLNEMFRNINIFLIYIRVCIIY